MSQLAALGTNVRTGGSSRLATASSAAPPCWLVTKKTFLSSRLKPVAILLEGFSGSPAS